MKKLLFSILAIFAIAGASITLPVTATYAAGTTGGAVSGDVCNSPNATDEAKSAAGCSGNTKDLESVIVGIINGVVGVFGVIAAIYIVVGGFNYMTSNGDASKVEKAKKTILYSVIGLIVAVLAFAIVNFVVANVLK